MNSKKIIIICSEFPPQPGGMGNHAYNLASQLTKKGYKVVVLTDYRSNTKQEEDTFDASKKFRILRIPRFQILLFTYVKRTLELRRLIKSFQPDCFIASGKFQLWLVAFGMNLKTIKKIGVIHGSEINLKNSWQQKLNDLALKKFDQVIAVSNFTKKLVERLNLKHISVISNGFEKAHFHRTIKRSYLKGSPKLITVGTLSERKGQHNVIKKLPALIQTYPDIHYHMVGTPLDRKRLFNLSEQLEVEKHITFHGIVNQTVLNNLLNESDIFVMLSEQTPEGDVEGFGIAILEANYLGLPAIGSLNCGIEDAINPDNSGILVRFDDEKSFIQAVARIYEHKDVYSEYAREWALKHTWDIVIDKYIEQIQRA